MVTLAEVAGEGGTQAQAHGVLGAREKASRAQGREGTEGSRGNPLASPPRLCARAPVRLCACAPMRLGCVPRARPAYCPFAWRWPFFFTSRPPLPA